MAIRTTAQGMDVWTISATDKKTRASFVPANGGTGSSIIMPHGNQERELLYLNDHFWQKGHQGLSGGSPFLFPICGRLERREEAGSYLYDGHVYNLPTHGFSYLVPWQVMSKNDHELTLTLQDSEHTRDMFPFRFMVSLIYRVNPGELICEQTYTNTGDKPMPYYAGFHPYFLTPNVAQGKEEVKVNFQPKKYLRYNDRLTDVVGEQEIFALPASILDPKINEQLAQVGTNKTTQLIFPDGFRINMEAKGVEDPNLFSYVHLYTNPEQPFFCIEPWMSFPNALNTVQGVRWLMPGQSERGTFRLWVSSK